jgi:predicted enzyme related to lactoylglutathione lyase
MPSVDSEIPYPGNLGRLATGSSATPAIIATVSVPAVESGSGEHVTGVGGVFFRAQDPHALVGWYQEHLGVPVTEGYVIFPESRDTHWVPFKADTDYWPAEKQAMVNFTVRDLDAMLAQLRSAGVPVDDKIEDGEFGRFGWATDPEGNRFELWEPPARSS